MKRFVKYYEAGLWYEASKRKHKIELLIMFAGLLPFYLICRTLTEQKPDELK